MARRKRPTIKGDDAAIALHEGFPVAKEDRAVRIPKEQLVARKAAMKASPPDAGLASLFNPAGREAVHAVAQGGQGRRRQRWEKANPERFQGAQDLLPEARNLNHRQISAREGWDTLEGDAAVDWDTTRAPAEGALPNPPRWEDMHPKQQARVLSAAADYGVTPESMKRSYRTQLQRGLIRDPAHASFYSERGQSVTGQDLPRERLEKSAQETGVPFHVQAAANAITSPQTAFIQTSKSGVVTYPNDDIAKAAVRYAQAGMSGEDYVEQFGPTPAEKAAGTREGKYPHGGYPANMARAIDVVKATTIEGKPLREAWNPGGRPGGGAGDKVRPFHNAWVDPTHPVGNFFVSDTHSGGGGMAPHLAGTEKETKYLSIAGIHSLHDYVARQVNEEHGLTSVSRSQSLQWNQEKIESEQGSAAGMFGAASVEAMRGNRNANQRQTEAG